MGRTWSPVPLSAEYGKPLYQWIGGLYAVPLDVLAILGLYYGRIPRSAKVFLLIPAIYFYAGSRGLGGLAALSSARRTADGYLGGGQCFVAGRSCPIPAHGVVGVRQRSERQRTAKHLWPVIRHT